MPMSPITEAPGLSSSLDDGVLRITFDRPGARNAISREMTVPLTRILTAARADDRVRCIVFGGAGGVFSAGGDVAGFRRALAEPVAERQAGFRARLDDAAVMVEALLQVDRPVVAALRGPVAGAGLAFVLAADLVVADETARLIFAHRAIGLTPDGGVTWLLPRVVGWRVARRLALTAATVAAPEALALGLVDRIVPGAAFDDEVAAAAAGFARAPRDAIARTRRLLDAAMDATLSAQLAREREAIADSVATADFEEGVSAFLEKRPARFPSAR